MIGYLNEQRIKALLALVAPDKSPMEQTIRLAALVCLGLRETSNDNSKRAAVFELVEKWRAENQREGQGGRQWHDAGPLT